MRVVGRYIAAILFLYCCVLQLYISLNWSCSGSGQPGAEDEIEPEARVVPVHRVQQEDRIPNDVIRLANDVEIVGDLDNGWTSTGGSDVMVAVGMTMTSRGFSGMSERTMKNRLPFFTTFLKSFCRTASWQYSYGLYVSFDDNDPYLSNLHYLEVFQQTFHNVRAQMRCLTKLNITLTMVKCRHSQHVAWAQNDALMEAYLDGATYFFRLNDDTDMVSRDLTSILIGALGKYHPPNVGVTGPNHKGGWLEALFEFVHRSHFEIFGCFYPRRFRDWFADQWLTDVYKPGRSGKVNQTGLLHTLGQGERYAQHDLDWDEFHRYVHESRPQIDRYISMLRWSLRPDKSKVISMTLYGRDIRYTYGAIRNAQLARLYFPGWTIRFYVPDCSGNFTTETTMCVPVRITRVIHSLGGVVVYVNPHTVGLPPKLWRHLVIDDPEVETFIVRNAHARLTQRDAIAVDSWLDTGVTVHCIRDHPEHGGEFLLQHLWGARTERLRQMLRNTTMLETLRKYHLKLHDVNIRSDGSELTSLDDVTYGVNILTHILYPVLNGDVICHDSVTCDRWEKSHPFPIPRNGGEYVGQSVDAYGQPLGVTRQDTHLPINCVSSSTTRRLYM